MKRITEPMPVSADPDHGKRRLLEDLEGALRTAPPGADRDRMTAKVAELRRELHAPIA